MKTRYTFTILRYIHDPVSGEFANVGIVMYAPEIKFLDSICTPTYRRLSAYFSGFNGEHFKRMMKHTEALIGDLSHTLAELPFSAEPKSVLDCVARVLPLDDSSLQFCQVTGSGTTADPQLTLNELYERYVERYGKKLDKPSRSDDEVMRIFKEPLAERQVLPKLTKRTIVGKDDFKLYLLLGKPADSKPLVDAFRRAERILDKIPIKHELVLEDEAQSFAKHVESDILEHEKQLPNE
jgi:hypothetical protein